MPNLLNLHRYYFAMPSDSRSWLFLMLVSTKKVYQENIVSETFTSTQSLLTQFRRQRLKVQTLQKSQSSGMNGERVSAMQQVLF